MLEGLGFETIYNYRTESYFQTVDHRLTASDHPHQLANIQANWVAGLVYTVSCFVCEVQSDVGFVF
jgi:hypothetical protein